MSTTAPHHGINLRKVLGPIHVWGLGVGIVLVGEFMGWNFAVGKGGALAALIACWVIGLLYTCVAMIDSEVTSTVAAAGGQYAQAKHIVGPLMAFNVALYLVLAYTMLEAGNAFVAADLLKTVAAQMGHPDLDSRPFVVLVITSLAWLNYRGVFESLTFNYVITAVAFVSILVLFWGVQPFSDVSLLRHADLLTGLPYGWIGVIASLQFGMWYYLGIEGTCQSGNPTGHHDRHDHAGDRGEPDLVYGGGLNALGIPRAGLHAPLRCGHSDRQRRAQNIPVRGDFVFDFGVGQRLY